MEFLNKYNLKFSQILKIGGLAILGVIVLVFLFRIVGSSFNAFERKNLSLGNSKGGFDTGMSYGEESVKSSRDYALKSKLSARNVAPAQQHKSSTGNTAEDYEITEYASTVETRDLKNTCARVAALKAKSYVIFENSNQYDTGCNFYFKVEKNYQEEILGVIKGLDPKTLVENTRTIKKMIDDYTQEEYILKKKKETIENTLNNAINSYDEISRVATQARDAESLAKIIDSKIRIIERLSQERINISVQLDRISRAKAEQLDRLDYTYFNVNIYENKYVNVDDLKDSWKMAIKKFVRDINRTFQDISINLLAAIFLIFQYALYILILIITAKYGWKIVKNIWNR
ncbi:hypothetical protein KAU09_02610 [Candidatus Parcubacteria bacterium]|nr:hypothetical protein [Candidatus Parcubacteria bacterium]